MLFGGCSILEVCLWQKGGDYVTLGDSAIMVLKLRRHRHRHRHLVTGTILFCL